ncbi:MAG: aminotransferase class I/II-fold pyridoxal phosphate-dependent enzyme [Pseudomonadota bacterium]|nr:aminotransferase class I/II-fold pyridoxal phosphate-dependent enzyme [Pseudomonadota bacterium]
MVLKIGKGASAPPFLVMDVISAANARQAALHPSAPHVIRMEVGQPGTGAPAGAIAAAQAALRSGHPLGYTEAFGLRSLRQRIATHAADWYGLTLPIERIAVTVGASGAFPLAFLAAFDPGDRVAMAAPFYPPYVNILTAFGMIPVILEAGLATRFQPSVAMLEQLDPLPDGLIVASPCNPAGTMLHPDELAAIADWCDRNGVRLISDEIYHGLNYDSPIASAGRFSDSVVVNSFSKQFLKHDRPNQMATASLFSKNAIAINSFSKYFGMTGWRIGWMVLPEDLIRPVERLAQNMFISAPHISQVAAEATFDCHEELQANVARYRRSRDFLLKALPQAGFRRLSPAEGAFYLWVDVSNRTNDSIEFCTRMLAEINVAVTPGVDFDHARGRQFIRISYCGPEADMLAAAARLKEWHPT